MGPINNNDLFTHDYHKFVLQEPNPGLLNVPTPVVEKKFDINNKKTSTTKKDLKKEEKKKERNPFNLSN